MSDSLIYFDHASTSGSKPEAVSSGIAAYLKEITASPGRGGYELEQRSYQLVSEVREQLAEMVGARQKERIAFTYNATHALNIVLKGLLKEDDHVIISCFEHNAVYRPLYKLSKENKISFDVWECDSLGQFNLNDLEKLIRPNTKLIALNHASNVLGILSPVEETGRIAKKYNIPFLIDVSQTAGLFPVSFENIADYIAGTGHKSLLGPSGIGYLYVKDSDTLETLYEGGSGINSLSPYQPEKCSKCSGKLIVRKSDSPETAPSRLRQFEETTKQVMEDVQKHFSPIIIDGNGSVEKVRAHFFKVIKL